MCGCEACGAQVRRDDRICPICGAKLGPAAGSRPHIPIRRFGSVPPLPEELEETLEDDGSPGPRRILAARPPRFAGLLLAAASAVALAACASYWLR